MIHTHMVFHFFLVLRREQRHIKINRKRECKPAFVRIRFCGERLEQTWHRFREVLHMRLLAQRIVRDVWFRAEIYRRREREVRYRFRNHRRTVEKIGVATYRRTNSIRRKDN